MTWQPYLCGSFAYVVVYMVEFLKINIVMLDNVRIKMFYSTMLMNIYQLIFILVWTLFLLVVLGGVANVVGCLGGTVHLVGSLKK